MIKRKIKLTSVVDVQKFNHIVGAYPFDMDLAHDRYVIDAKSIMGLFSLNLANDLELTIYAEEKETEVLLNELQEFLI